MSKGKLISLEGLDGVGKTTCVEYLCEKLAKTENVVYVHRKTVPTTNSYVQKHMQNLYDIMWGKGAVFSEAPNLPYNGFTREHWLHLMLVWYSAFEKYVISPLIDEGTTVITDGYIYKEVVKAIYSSGTVETEKEFNFLIHPDIVLYLTASPEKCYRKESQKNRIENGEFVGTEDGFVGHQTRMQKIYDTLAIDHNWLIIERSENVKITCKRILRALEESRV